MSKGHNSAENDSTETRFKRNFCILVANLCTKFHLKIFMYDRENERKLNPEGRKGITLYAPAISWRGHKKTLCTYVYVYMFEIVVRMNRKSR